MQNQAQQGVNPTHYNARRFVAPWRSLHHTDAQGHTRALGCCDTHSCQWSDIIPLIQSTGKGRCSHMYISFSEEHFFNKNAAKVTLN